MYKLVFNILINPLNLPLDWWKEYLILFSVGQLAYLLAYRFIGRMMDEKLITNKKSASLFHWVFRFAIYFTIWAFLRVGIGVFI